MAALTLLAAQPPEASGEVRSYNADLTSTEWQAVQLMRLTGVWRGGDNITPNMPLRWAISETLAGPPEPDTPLQNGWRLSSACRHNSCDEKAAVIWDDQDRIRAAALIHFRCSAPGWLPSGARACDNEPSLTIIQYPEDAARTRQPLLDWDNRHIEIGAVEYLLAACNPDATCS